MAASASETSRDFPTPASPTMVTSSQRSSARTRSQAATSDSSSRSRPTNRVAWLRSGAPNTETRRDAGTGPRLPLQRQRLDRLGHDRLVHERERRLADQHLMRGGGLLESCCNVDRIARGESFLRPSHHLARVDADAAGDPQLGQRVAHLDRSTTRPQCIVLVRLRDAEHRHHGVANELLDGAAVSLDDRLHLLEVACEQRPQRLGIGLLSQLGRPAEVAEQDGHRLADFARG